MRAIFTVLVAISIGIVAAASSAHAQERVTAFAFAPSKHIAVDKKSSDLGKLTDSVEDYLEPLRGERGKTLLVGCIGLAILTLILGMPFAALVAAGIAVLLILLNQPIILVGVLVGAVLIRKQLYALLFSSKDSDDHPARKSSELPGAKKDATPSSETKTTEPKPSAPVMPKLARPL